MSYRIKDLASMAKNVNQRLEQRSQDRGEELANHVLQRTAQGRGLWFIILWPAWLFICIVSGMFFIGMLGKFGIDVPVSWIGMVGGAMLARVWYVSSFTVNHPFWSSVFSYFGITFSAIVLAHKLGISL